jgi:hypothetical protein
MNWKGCLHPFLLFHLLLLFRVNNSNKVVFSVSNNSQTSLWNKGGTGTPKSSFYCTNYLHIVPINDMHISSAAYSVNYNGHAEGRPINSIFYKLNLKDLEIHNKLPLEEHIYELEGVFASIPVISPPPVISHTMKGEFLI